MAAAVASMSISMQWQWLLKWRKLMASNVSINGGNISNGSNGVISNVIMAAANQQWKCNNESNNGIISGEDAMKAVMWLK